MFKRVDQNQDGSVDKTELTALVEKMQEKTGSTIDVDATMTAWDQDQNGVLSQQELATGMESRRALAGPPGAPPEASSANGPSAATSTADGSSTAADAASKTASRFDPFTQVMQNLMNRLLAAVPSLFDTQA